MNPLMFEEYKDMNAEEANIASSDLSFLGYLIEVSTDAKSGNDEGGNRYYKFIVLEVFKGNIKKDETVEVIQKRGYCDFPLLFDQEYVVYLNADEKGINHLGLASTHIFSDRVLDLSDPDDKQMYEELVANDMAKEYVVKSQFEDGSPRVVVRPKENLLKRIRDAAASLNKRLQPTSG